MGSKRRLILGKKKQLNREGWISAYVKPSGKFWKRLVSKKMRKYVDDVSSGAAHKKTWGPFEWS